jgi:hypothetical protein
MSLLDSGLGVHFLDLGAHDRLLAAVALQLSALHGEVSLSGISWRAVALEPEAICTRTKRKQRQPGSQGCIRPCHPTTQWW